MSRNGFRQPPAPTKQDLASQVKTLAQQVDNLKEYLSQVAEQVTQTFNGFAFEFQNFKASYSAMDFVNKSLRKMLQNKAVFTEAEWNDFSETERKTFLNSIETESDIARNLTVVDRESAIGDIVSVDLTGYDEEGKLVGGFEQHFLEIILGQDNPNFNRAHNDIEQHLIGVKKGDKKEKIELVLDEKFGPELQGKKVFMNVNVLKVKELKQETKDIG